MEYIIVYLIVFAVFLFMNAFIQGYEGGEITTKDIIQSFFWVIYLPVVLGTITRVIIEKYKSKSKKPVKPVVPPKKGK